VTQAGGACLVLREASISLSTRDVKIKLCALPQNEIALYIAVLRAIRSNPFSLASFLDSNRRQQSENGHKTTQLLPRAESSSPLIVVEEKPSTFVPITLKSKFWLGCASFRLLGASLPCGRRPTPNFFCCQKVLTKHVVSAQNFCPNDLGLS